MFNLDGNCLIVGLKNSGKTELLNFIISKYEESNIYYYKRDKPNIFPDKGIIVIDDFVYRDNKYFQVTFFSITNNSFSIVFPSVAIHIIL